MSNSSRLRRVVPLAVLLLAALVAAILVLGRSPGTAAAAAPPANDGVTVSGIGKVSGTPDVLRLDLGVFEHGSDVNAALGAANADLGRVRAALRKHGVAPKDIQTSTVNIGPDYGDKGVIKGYQVSEGLIAKLRDLPGAGVTISDAAAAGGNATRINGVSFDLEDNAALLAKARTAAYDDARAKARQYATLTGRQLGEVRKLSESTDQPPVNQRFAAMSQGAAAPSAPVPIDPGSQQVSVQVDVVWSLK